MTTQQPDWHAYLAQMETVLGVTLDDALRGIDGLFRMRKEGQGNAKKHGDR